jgi:Tannase and feruloyl esterase
VKHAGSAVLTTRTAPGPGKNPMRRKRAAWHILFTCAALIAGSEAMADCASLLKAGFPDTVIRQAQAVASGTFAPSDQSGAPVAVFRQLPAFCRVIGVIRPTSDSQIGFELWLPDVWNGRYLQIGNGGFAGLINYGGLAPGLRNGFAVASTDDGHTGTGAA